DLKRTLLNALAAGNTFVLIDLCPPQVVRIDGVDPTGLSTGPIILNDGVIGAGVPAAAALNAFLLINVGLMLTHGNGVYRTDIDAGVRNALAAVGSDFQPFRRTGFAGKGDDIDQ